MPTWKTAVGAGSGATVTVLGVGATAVFLPFVGLLAERTVGGWLPAWLFVLPLFAWPMVGGALAAAVGGGERNTSVLVGGVAGGLGAATIGGVAGGLFFVLLAGMTPGHAGTVPVDLSATTVGYGAGGGALVGFVLGAVGGFGVFYVRGRPTTSEHDA